MSSVYGTFYNWARKTTTSIGELRFVPSQRDDAANHGDRLIYRLRHWPDLPSHDRTAGVFRALSVMSNRPVNRRWILDNSRLRSDQLDQLLRRLMDEGAVEAFDGSKFANTVTDELDRRRP